MTATATPAATTTRTIARRVRSLQVGVALQGFMLWVPVEKLFQTEIGFDAASIALMAAAYAAVVPILEVPSGILADRWSRTGVLVLSTIAAGASALIGGLSTNVATYIAAAMVLGVFFALNSGTIDSVVYDTVVEETGASEAYEAWIGRVRLVESVALAAGAIAGGLLAQWTSPRLTYFLTIGPALAAVVAFHRFREPQLHRVAERVALRQHVATTVRAMTQVPQVRRMLLVAALTALLSQAVFEFGPLWFVELDAPPAAYGPYWALLVGTLGLGGYLAAKLQLHRGSRVVVVAVLLLVPPVLLATTRMLLVVALAQTALLLLVAVIGIHAGRLLHDAVPPTIRAGVSSGSGTFSWLLFLPFSLVFGVLARDHGVSWGGWLVVAAVAVLAVLFAVFSRAARAATAQAVDRDGDAAPRPLTEAPPPPDLACQQLVRLVSDYVDGILPDTWRARVDEHLHDCDGCRAYLQQIRATIDLLEERDAERRRT